MEKRKDIVDEALRALKDEQVPEGPPKEVADAVAAKLAQASEDGWQRSIRQVSFAKLAAAAVFLVVASYAVGRLTVPRPPDVGQLHAALESSLRASLEPAIRDKVVDELDQRWQMALAGSYAELRDEVTEQFRHDLGEFALRTLAASGAVTNQHLTQLVEAIGAAQTRERLWTAAALEQIELNRLRDKQQLVNGFETLAIQTGGELARTRKDMVRLLTYDGSEQSLPGMLEIMDDPNERSRK
ncbi:MAG: hypothetical protein ACYS29_16080 [Planctomycetota bacterium]|jgi:hypothetical protein